MPKPRNESAASTRIARPTISVRVDDDRPDRVREDVAEHDADVAGAGRLRSLDVLLLAQGEEAAAHDAGKAVQKKSARITATRYWRRCPRNAAA